MYSTSERPLPPSLEQEKTALRVLHVVGGMTRGGIETWLMHLLRTVDRQQIAMDFLVHTEAPNAYDDEARALGARIIPCLDPAQPLTYARNLRRILRQYGPYDIIHSHVHHFSGWVLLNAKLAGIPVRIAHSHNDTLPAQQHVSTPRRLYLNGMEMLIRRFSNAGLTATRQAGASLFGADWERVAHNRVLYYGIDLTPFYADYDDAALRAELGIPPDAFVVGHIGRLTEQKNHAFILQIAKAVLAREPKAYFLLMGEGELRAEIEAMVETHQLNGRVILPGTTPNVARYLKGAMDVFLFPSLYEGFGLVLLEAQAAGLPCIYADHLPNDVAVVEPLLTALSLNQPADVWAEAVLSARQAAISPAAALDIVAASPFRIQHSQQALLELYDDLYSRYAPKR